MRFKMARQAQVAKKLMAPMASAQVSEELGALIRRWPGTWAGLPCPQRSGIGGFVSVRGLTGRHCDSQSSPRQLGFDFLINRQLSLLKCLCCHLQHIRSNSMSVTAIWFYCHPSLPDKAVSSLWGHLPLSRANGLSVKPQAAMPSLT